MEAFQVSLRGSIPLSCIVSVVLMVASLTVNQVEDVRVIPEAPKMKITIEYKLNPSSRQFSIFAIPDWKPEEKVLKDMLEKRGHEVILKPILCH